MNKLLLSVVLVGLVAGCTTNPYTGQEEVSETGIDAAVGAVVGAGVGALVDDGTGALVGGAGGAAIGAAIGEGTKDHDFSI